MPWMSNRALNELRDQVDNLQDELELVQHQLQTLNAVIAGERMMRADLDRSLTTAYQQLAQLRLDNGQLALEVKKLQQQPYYTAVVDVPELQREPSPDDRAAQVMRNVAQLDEELKTPNELMPETVGPKL